MEEDLRGLKRALRRDIASKLSRIEPRERSESSRALAGLLQRWPGWKEMRTVLSFMSTLQEIDTAPINRLIIASGKSLGLPRVLSNELVFHRVMCPDRIRITNRYGILEPSRTLPRVDIGSGTLVLLPGLAFDGSGGRLGRGRGFYDRFLAHLDGIVTMGICFDFQLIARVPTDQSDRCVQWVATDCRIVESTSGGPRQARDAPN